jgi:hypothetical protein
MQGAMMLRSRKLGDDLTYATPLGADNTGDLPSGCRHWCIIFRLGWTLLMNAGGRMRLTLTVLTAAVLAACAATQPIHWSKSGATQEMFTRDHSACVQQTQVDPWSFYRGESLSSCMEARGYKEDPNGNLFPPPEQVATAGPVPIPAAVGAASEDYKRAVADYRNCLAANPKNVNACEGQRHIMDADAQVLGGASQGAR